MNSQKFQKAKNLLEPNAEGKKKNNSHGKD